AEVLEQLEAMNTTQSLESEGLTVDPHQFLGIELNPRAAAIAELVLWIGYLQWHYKTRGQVLPAAPILRDFKNIECRDAVLRHAGIETVRDANGQPQRQWDGKTSKKHPVTGKDIPDESATIEQVRYLKPQTAHWPKAEIVVGNPPFIGASAMRRALGDGYVDALRQAHADVPDSADLVMFWWNHAAQLLKNGDIQRFGFITTNSLTQTFNRRVLEKYLGHSLHLAFAIPDHPWVDNADGAAVRVAMTSAESGDGSGELLNVVGETPNPKEGTVDVVFEQKNGRIHADLTVGANVASALTLQANTGLGSRGYQLIGGGFIVTPEEAAQLEADAPIKNYRNGRDLTDRPRGVKIIDLFGLTVEEVRQRYPACYQWVYERVKPERDQNARAGYRDNWWIFGEARRDMRAQLAGLPRYIATVETAKHRTFQFLDASIAPDNKLICIAMDDAYALGVLSSNVHVVWVLAAGSTLEDRPVYVKTTCFETFPFPAATDKQKTTIAHLAEQLDLHRKRVLAEHPELTLTGLYNVLSKLQSAETTLSAKEQAIHQKGQVSLLQSLHAELDSAVIKAYGWPDLLPSPACGRGAGGEGEPTPTLLERLVALNHQRANEEQAGQIRWLRPAFQSPETTPAPVEPSSQTLRQKISENLAHLNDEQLAQLLNDLTRRPT
ncbi:MAG: class I SAM-dependent DNA methyltransferase, partial [Rhodocyclaceae bacterium]|nr:class I SAM-dependent DNA methyltransferase [Rhodocyclaceae bacterium]